MEILLNAAHMKAAAYCAADKDIRYYLNGVLVETTPTEQRIVATDGHCAAVLRQKLEQPALPEVIIPNATIKLALGTKSATLALRFDAGAWSLGGVPFVPVDGKFPDYRRIIPTQATGEAAQFNVDLLAKFTKAAKALGHKGPPIVRHNGNGGAQIQLYGRDDEFVGVIMPLRAFTEKRPDTGMSSWGAERS